MTKTRQEQSITIIKWMFSVSAIIQKRLKKEKKAKRKLQEALEFETKRREQAEQALKQAASSEGLRVLNVMNMRLHPYESGVHIHYFNERYHVTAEQRKSCGHRRLWDMQGPCQEHQEQH
ncbi:unnamed protein product [Ranitomeya imitator]|uniref:Uncharacterized protein n=1 Tax=Ranitomeya imitator TaxID=111125 RepID=A0ABN9L1T5_9NEOB|nr:unnamed protein product [Ranitomeya imitator]